MKVAGQAEPYLEVRPVNWAWGRDDGMLQALLILLVSPGDVLARVMDAHDIPSAPLPPRVVLELCSGCTSADAWAPVVAAGVEVRWERPFNLFHPEPPSHTCTC